MIVSIPHTVIFNYVIKMIHSYSLIIKLKKGTQFSGFL